jgi:hypothetical protein
MFGIGNGSGEAQDTRSIWGDMLGIGPLMKVLTDPALQAHTHAMMTAVIEGANATRRVELKLNLLLKALGHEYADIDAQHPSPFAGAPILIAHGANGGGGHAAATGAPDDGSRGASQGAATNRGGAGNGGGIDPAGGARS